ncbi:class I SAM-dependent methyltransferase [Sphingomonas sp. RP10(2022)]|uniref:Class I SAM-dependent methyltransferase n=1 Tax=Sphingomonas liriopis TaxID=2949094 RepID=A0A9X2HV97_9SPHN|nr:class I SAM-dependent methyltransferase [Sphingomonas liriopis]MCP3733325.1 class I SAM-dependent methyltransferase [Sphingomonas liriopis]
MTRIRSGHKEDMMDRRQPDPAGWTTGRGNAWVALQPMLDGLFLPFERILADMMLAQGVQDVLDIGCGAGATSLAIAEVLRPSGTCTGIDISEALVKVARDRAIATGLGNARFLCADAQRHDFDPEAYDAIVSRFGVMFFDDPVAAFANIRRALRPAGTLACIVWRSPGDNRFMATAERAAAAILGPQPASDPHAPGQFAFADDGRVHGILTDAGWDTIDIRPIAVPCELSAKELPVYARRMGRIGTILPRLDDAERIRLETALDEAFAPFVVGEVARFGAACWMVRARKP